MRALLLSCFAIGALGALGSSAAQDDQPDCAWQSAEAVSVQAFYRSGVHYRGRCIRARGRLNGRSLSAIQSNGRELSVGAYFEDEALRDGYFERPRRVEVLGVAGHCSDICAGPPNPDEICMPVGHCHYHDDPYVLIQAVR